MTCIKTLNKAITYDCRLGGVGIAEMYLIDFDDVTATTENYESDVLTLTLKAGAKTVPVVAYKNGAKLTEALKLSDVSAGLDQTITFTVYDKGRDSQLIVNALMYRRFMAAVKLKDINAAKRLVGYKCGLEISQADADSSAAGGFTTITIKTPDDAGGEKKWGLSDEAWGTIVSARLV